MNLNFFSANGNGATGGKEEGHDELPLFGQAASQYDGQHTYRKYGFLQSRNHGADPIALQVELKKIMESFRDKVRRDEQEQEKLKLPVRKGMEATRVELEKLAAERKAVLEEEIPEIKEKIGALKEEILQVRKHPEAYREGRPNRLSFYFGLVIFALLTVYLWIFYTSASYSAFFRKFNVDDINVANSIFDARALSNAYSDGIPAFVLVVSMPFIFIALGYLIHKFSEGRGARKYGALALLILVTFGFDYIIAYEIVKKIYDLQVMNSLTEQPPYSFRMAFSDINFWLIIFAGFVTYLIWGFLFDRLMHTYEQFDLVTVQISLRQREIGELKGELKGKELAGKDLANRMYELEKGLKQANQDLEATYFKPKEFEYVIYQFGSGWMQYIEGGLIMNEERKKALRQEVKGTIEKFVHENNNGVFYEQV